MCRARIDCEGGALRLADPNSIDWRTQRELTGVSMPLEFVSRRQGREFLVRLRLIPERDRGDVVLQRKVAPSRLPAKVLDSHLQLAFKANRVRYVPAIEAETLL